MGRQGLFRGSRTAPERMKLASSWARVAGYSYDNTLEGDCSGIGAAERGGGVPRGGIDGEPPGPGTDPEAAALWWPRRPLLPERQRPVGLFYLDRGSTSDI